MSRDEDQFVQQVRAALDQVEADVPPHVAARLRQARHKAVAAPYHRVTPSWIPAWSSAMLLVLAIGVAWFAHLSQIDAPAPLPTQQAATDFEILVHGEDLQLFADLDFYLWLEKQNGHTS